MENYEDKMKKLKEMRRQEQIFFDFRSDYTLLIKTVKKLLRCIEENPDSKDDFTSLIYWMKGKMCEKEMNKINEFITMALMIEDEKVNEIFKAKVLFRRRYEELYKLKNYISANKISTQGVIGEQGDNDNQNQKQIRNSETLEIMAENERLLHKKRVNWDQFLQDTQTKIPKNEVKDYNNNNDDDKNKSNNNNNNDYDKNKNNYSKYIGIARLCYICKKDFNYNNSHFFYSNLCKECSDYNYSFRTLTIDLSGRIAIVTGGRVKIGFQIAMKLLNYNANVIVTTRFPNDCLKRFKQEIDYNILKKKLVIYPVDFRFWDATKKFVEYLFNNYSYIDILINNAAQTVRRDTNYYKYLLRDEQIVDTIPHEDISSQDNSHAQIIVCTETISLTNANNNFLLESGVGDKIINKNENIYYPKSVLSSQLEILPSNDNLNKSCQWWFDENSLPYDFNSKKNSWDYQLDEVPFQEFMEVQLINTWTPYYWNAKWKPWLEKSPSQDRYIVNVTSVEGIFNHFKTTKHPHTNMAKAALNMMTRTVGKYFKSTGIYMTCVDTGWVSSMHEINKIVKSMEQEQNKQKRENAQENDTDEWKYEKQFVNIPLDEIDGAMRVLHPIIEGVKNKKFWYQCLLKDYKISNW